MVIIELSDVGALGGGYPKSAYLIKKAERLILTLCVTHKMMRNHSVSKVIVVGYFKLHGMVLSVCVFYYNCMIM